MYNRLVEHCFQGCVTQFPSKKLDPKETKCVDTCVEKFMKFSQRTGMRFAEHQYQQQETQRAEAGGPAR